MCWKTFAVTYRVNKLSEDLWRSSRWCGIGGLAGDGLSFQRDEGSPGSGVGGSPGNPGVRPTWPSARWDKWRWVNGNLRPLPSASSPRPTSGPRRAHPTSPTPPSATSPASPPSPPARPRRTGRTLPTENSRHHNRSNVYLFWKHFGKLHCS